MDVSSYGSGFNDREWVLLEPLGLRSHPAVRRQVYPLRRIIDAIFYLLRTGSQWRMLPHEYPPCHAVFYHYAQWRETGLWEQVTRALREKRFAARLVVLLNPRPLLSTANRSELRRWADRGVTMVARRSRAASAN